jgi:dTDP-4-dehydrorhamnose reductase
VGRALTGSVLVTGAGGLLGGQVAWTLARTRGQVYAFTRAQLDVTDAAQTAEIVRNVRPSLVIHCAAMTNVDACEDEPGRAFAVNAEGSANIAAAADSVGAEIVAISTDYVFDGERGAYTEADPTNPIQVYGRSKLEGENAVREANAKHYVVRSAWIYGPGGKNHLSKLPDYVETGTPVSAVVDQHGCPTYAPDLADAIGAVAGSGRFGTYHVVNQGVCSFAEFFDFAVEQLGSDLEVKHITLEELGRPAPRPHNTSLVGDAWRHAGFPLLRGWREAAAAFLGL